MKRGIGLLCNETFCYQVTHSVCVCDILLLISLIVLIFLIHDRFFWWLRTISLNCSLKAHFSEATDFRICTMWEHKRAPGEHPFFSHSWKEWSFLPRCLKDDQYRRRYHSSTLLDFLWTRVNWSINALINMVLSAIPQLPNCKARFQAVLGSLRFASRPLITVLLNERGRWALVLVRTACCFCIRPKLHVNAKLILRQEQDTVVLRNGQNVTHNRPNYPPTLCVLLRANPRFVSVADCPLSLLVR